MNIYDVNVANFEIMTICRRYRSGIKHHVSRNKLYGVVVAVAVVVLFTFRSFKGQPFTGSKFDVYTHIFGDYPLPEATQHVINQFAENVHLNISVLDNFASGQTMYHGGYYLTSISLFNSGTELIPAVRWQLYGYLLRLAEPMSYPYPDGFNIYDCGLKLFLVEGCLYKFEPAGNAFFGLKPGERITCTIKLAAFQIARTDSMPRWYVTGDTVAPKVVANTDDESLSFVSDFTEPKQYKRRIDDIAHPYSPAERYSRYKAKRSETITTFKIIPTPLELKVNDRSELHFNTNNWVIVKSEIFLREVQSFADGMQMKIVKSKPNRRYIQIIKSPVMVTINKTPVQHPEAYTLTSDPQTESITIQASSDKGVFYALQTFSSIVFAPEALTNVGIMLRLPGFTVTDGPRYNYRGLHLDVARNFIEIDQVLKILDVMSMYKLNKLHLHLSDDEGWRLEIPDVPELTNIGGSRCHDLEEQECILPMLGSGPYSNTSGSGYYTVRDYKEILAYADARKIEVIPEFDMPGHSRAAIKSIHAKKQRYMRKETKKKIYSIVDDNDSSVFRSGQNFGQNVVNPCMPSTYDFVQKIIQEVMKMHQGIQPLSFYHFGGDEVADGGWKGSQACKELKEKRSDIKTQFDIMKYFINNLTKMLAQEGLSVGAWEDAMLEFDSSGFGTPFPRKSFQNKDIYVYVWKKVTEKRTPYRANLLANQDYKVILAYGAYLYFDHPYEPDPEERGLYWASRKLSTYDAWRFTQNVMSADRDLDCPLSITNKQMCFKLLKPENVMGIQAELWTETVRTNEHVEYMLFPRLLAVAERAWHKASWEDMDENEAKEMKATDWSEFVNKVGYHELPRLDKAGIHYRIPPPGAIIVNNKVRFNTEFPGLEIEYYDDVSKKWQLASHNMHIYNAIKIRARSSDGQRHSRTITVDPAKDDSYMTSGGSTLSRSFVDMLTL